MRKCLTGMIQLIHTYVRTYVRTYVHTYIHTYSCTYIHTYIHTYTYIHSYIVHTYIHTYKRTYIHTYIHTNIHTYIHTYTYIEILFHLPSLVSHPCFSGLKNVSAKFPPPSSTPGTLNFSLFTFSYNSFCEINE